MTGKDNILAFPGRLAIEAEAAAWVARFDAGDVSPEDDAAFQEWLNRSALHGQVIAEFSNLWSEFDTLRWPVEPGVAGRKAAFRDGHPAMLKRAIPWLAACAAAVIAISGSAALFQPKRASGPVISGPAIVTNQPATPLFYETAVGGQKRITLADGSSVVLNTDSRMEVNFSGNRREVHLMRGEAYFEVVHDQTRPFTVYANTYVVRDIGTAFDVHMSRGDVVEVNVTKGVVELTPMTGAPVLGAAKKPRFITAGHDIVLTQDAERAETKSSPDMGRKLSWLQGKLVYSGQPLGDVLADISRYSNIKVELADATLENLPVGGAFQIDQTDAIFSALEKNFGLHAEWIDPQHVRFTAEREEAPATMITPQRGDGTDPSEH